MSEGSLGSLAVHAIVEPALFFFQFPSQYSYTVDILSLNKGLLYHCSSLFQVCLDVTQPSWSCFIFAICSPIWNRFHACISSFLILQDPESVTPQKEVCQLSLVPTDLHVDVFNLNVQSCLYTYSQVSTSLVWVILLPTIQEYPGSFLFLPGNQ